MMFNSPQITQIYTNCHSEQSEESRVHQVYVIEILPPFGRLDDKLFTKICGAKK